MCQLLILWFKLKSSGPSLLSQPHFLHLHALNIIMFLQYSLWLTSMPLFWLFPLQEIPLLCPTPYSPLSLSWDVISRKASELAPTSLGSYHPQGQIRWPVSVFPQSPTLTLLTALSSLPPHKAYLCIPLLSRAWHMSGDLCLGNVASPGV